DVENGKTVSRKLYELKRQLSTYEAEELKDKSKGKIIFHLYEEKEINDLQLIAEKLLDDNFFVILGSVFHKQIIVNRAEDSLINVGEFFKEKVKAFNGRGGG